jgi:hypothetical protein
MSVVYRARDTRLGRDVALKVLAEALTADRVRLRRLENEARAASALNHPNIVTVHEIDEVEDQVFLVMELVEGQTLHDVLSRRAGPLELKDALRIGVQMAEGLAKAHESGIIHRDLKPDNVMITDDGLVKVLDFGLAKVEDLVAGTGPSEEARTSSKVLTQPGTVVGTVGYMAPEQIRGERATPQSDQFSLGCILFEMLSGKRAFSAPSAVDTLSAILRDEAPSLETTNPEVPAPLRWIVERCLAKAPRERYQSTTDLARDLRNLRERSVEASLRPAVARLRGRLRRYGVPLAAALALLATGAFARRWLDSRAAPPGDPEWKRLTFRDGIVTRALFTPNAGSVLYSAAWGSDADQTFLTLPESSGLDRVLDGEPQMPMAYSEDGTEVLVVLGVHRDSLATQGDLAWWPALGGKPRRLLENAGWADWADQGRFLVVARSDGAERLLEVRSADGALKRTLFRTGGAVRFPRLSPDEKSVAFIHHPSRFDDAGEVRWASVDGTAERALTDRLERCTGLDWNAVSGEVWFTGSRRNIYSSALLAVGPREKSRPRTILAMPEVFSLHGLSAGGDQALLVRQESRMTLTVRRGSEPPQDLSWMGWTMASDVSADGKHALFFDGGNTDRAFGAWVRPVDGGDAVRLGDVEPGAFSPDGQSMVGITRGLAGQSHVVLVPLGTGQARALTAGPGDDSMPTFAGAGTVLFVRSQEGRSEVWRVGTDGKDPRSLGVSDCDLPSADPAARWFVCRATRDKGVLFAHSLGSALGRRIDALRGRDVVGLRWTTTGRILAITAERRLVSLDSTNGAVLAETLLPANGPAIPAHVVRAATSPDGLVQAYSMLRASSSLYGVRGLR